MGKNMGDYNDDAYNCENHDDMQDPKKKNKDTSYNCIEIREWIITTKSAEAKAHYVHQS